ncbi:MAG: GNAT family N-acetyltransferase [Coprobacillus sp.]
MEAAKGCKEYAFNRYKVNKVYCIIKRDNQASIKLAKNLGMKIEDEFITQYYHVDMLHYLFSIES